jgi:hypothetical protein
LGPAPHKDRDYSIGSNFWKFYLVKTGFTLGELVLLVKEFRLFRLEQIFFVVQSVKKYVWSFHIIQSKPFFLCAIMGMGKSNNKKKGAVSYVVMFGYGKGLAHCMCSHVWLW